MAFAGQNDTRIKTGEDYETRTLASLFTMEPADKPKGSGAAFIPSVYCDYDGREHKAQRERGSYVALTGDIDKDNHSIERIETLVRAFTGSAAYLIYSSAHAQQGDMRWRVIVPLEAPIPFEIWHDAQNAFFDYMEAAGVSMDRSLNRAAQPVYLPNVPTTHAKSGTPLRALDGTPMFYRRTSSETAAPGLAITSGAVAAGIAGIRQKRADDDRERDRIRQLAEQRRVNRPSGDGGNVIADFNSTNTIATMLELCGYEQSPRHAEDWRSPNQTGETYATRVIGDKWISLSGSDAACGVGESCSSGCYGDAYDLFVHYKHGGDHKAAFRQIHQERNGARSDHRTAPAAERSKAPSASAAMTGRVSATTEDPIVYVCDNQNDTDRLAHEGLVAACHVCGDGKPNAALTAIVTGRRVVVIQSNSDSGAARAAYTAKVVTRTAARAVVVKLPDMPPKSGVGDWLDAKRSLGIHSVFDLTRLAEQALDAPSDIFDIADLAVWAQTTPTPKSFVMAPFIPRDDVVIITGDGGTNKSTLALQISACSAANKQMLGMDVVPGPALYITAEDDQRENHWRLNKIADAIGTSVDKLVGRLHIVSLRGRLNNELATFDNDGKLRPAPAYKTLRATIEHTGAKLVTLDNVAHLFAGNENDRSHVTAFVNLLYQICGDLGVTILLIAHRNKAGDSYSGSTAWLNAVRSQLLMERSDENDADMRRLSLGKANYARQGETVDFRWHDFALKRNDDLPKGVGDELAATVRANADNAIFLRCLAERNRQRRVVSESKNARTYAPKEFADMPESKGIGRSRLEAAMDRLFRTNSIERGFVWRNGAEGKDVEGLREIVPGAAAPPDDLPADYPLTPSADYPLTARQHPLSHTSPLRGDAGAASKAAASGMILAPGETGDDPIPGWNDQ
jgi:RecA-family ATPase